MAVIAAASHWVNGSGWGPNVAANDYAILNANGLWFVGHPSTDRFPGWTGNLAPQPEGFIDFKNDAGRFYRTWYPTETSVDPRGRLIYNKGDFSNGRTVYFMAPWDGVYDMYDAYNGTLNARFFLRAGNCFAWHDIIGKPNNTIYVDTYQIDVQLTSAGNLFIASSLYWFGKAMAGGPALLFYVRPLAPGDALSLITQSWVLQSFDRAGLDSNGNPLTKGIIQGVTL